MKVGFKRSKLTSLSLPPMSILKYFPLCSKIGDERTGCRTLWLRKKRVSTLNNSGDSFVGLLSKLTLKHAYKRDAFE